MLCTCYHINIESHTHTHAIRTGCFYLISPRCILQAEESSNQNRFPTNTRFVEVVCVRVLHILIQIHAHRDSGRFRVELVIKIYCRLVWCHRFHSFLAQNQMGKSQSIKFMSAIMESWKNLYFVSNSFLWHSSNFSDKVNGVTELIDFRQARRKSQHTLLLLLLLHFGQGTAIFEWRFLLTSYILSSRSTCLLSIEMRQINCSNLFSVRLIEIQLKKNENYFPVFLELFCHVTH